MAVFVLLLQSCVHDEIYSSSDPTSKEYHSKSLWKEDEKYIKNVMKVYFENESEIKKTSGIPYWDYATTINNFDESFLMVPVVDGGKVVSVLKVPRHEKKIYFYYTNSNDDLEFFQGLVFSKYRKPLKSDDVSETSKITCNRQWISIWVPDNNNNPDGPGHWDTRSVIRCRQEIDQCVGVINELGQCEGSGNGNPGYPYPGMGGGTPDTEPETPCEKTKPSITNANNILKNNNIQQKMDAVLKGKVNATKEWAVAVGQKPDGSYEVTPAVEQNQYSGSVPSSQLTSAYIGDGHSHSGTPGVPSAGDLYGMLEIVAVNPNFGIRFVYGVSGGNTEVYSLVLNDQAAAIQFLATYPRSENYDPLTHSFKRGKLDDEIVKIKSMYGANATKDSSGHYYDAKALGLAYIFDNLNAGISLSKVDTNGNLKKINASIESVGSSGGKAVVSECP